MATGEETAEALRSWWRTGNWERLAPALSVRMRRQRIVQTMDTDDADDLVQRVLVRCVALPHVPDNPGGFVARMAQNLRIDDLRRAGEQATRERHIDWYLAAAPTDPEAPALPGDPDSVDLLRLRIAISRLDHLSRRCFVLTARYGQGSHEIAANLTACGYPIKPAAVRMRVMRARRTLYALLTGQYHPKAHPRAAYRLGLRVDV